MLLAYSTSGRSSWGDVVLLGGGLLVAFGLLFGLVRVGRQRGRRRVAVRGAVAAAAAPADGPFSVASLRDAGEELFARFLPAWAAQDLDALGTLGDAHALADASVRVGRGQPHIAAGPVFDGPHIDVVGVAPDAPDPHADLHVRARVGTRMRYVGYDAYWTIAPGRDGWTIRTIRTPHEAASRR